MSCDTWKLADTNTPLGRYHHNLSEGWASDEETTEDGSVANIEVEEEIPHYVDLLLYKRRFEMIYYEQGSDSIIEFTQYGRWYMEKQNDSMFVVLKYKKKRNLQRMRFSDNGNNGFYDELYSIPGGEMYQKTDKVF
jgi:hypothetical protein